MTSETTVWRIFIQMPVKHELTWDGKALSTKVNTRINTRLTL